jgi:hypothetical protein
MSDQQHLQRAARDLVLDHLIAPDLDPAQMSDEKLASLYDQLMDVPGAVKVASDEAAALAADPQVLDVAKVAEVDILGRTAAHAYANTFFKGLDKYAQGLEGIRARLMGTSPEERLERERARREQELSLKPREVSLSLGARGAGGSLDTDLALQGLGVTEATQRQELANQLRKLQLGDQYARREREERLFQQLHGENQVAGPLTHALAGGALGGMAGSTGRSMTGGLADAMKTLGVGGGLGARARSAMMQGAEGMGKLKLPGIRGGATAGLGVYLARKLLTNPNPATRPVTRLERERYIPGSMQADVQP